MRKYISLKATLLAAAILLNNVCGTVSQAALKGGCVKVDITPRARVWLAGYGSRDKPSDGIADALYAKALVLDDGQNKLAIVSVDLLWVPIKITAEIRRKVKEKIGIPEKNVLICATHTHFGPKIDRITKNWPDTPASEIDESYVQTLKKKIVDSILSANKKLKEVKLGAVKGEISEIVYNRRTTRTDGSVAMTFRLPPANPEFIFGPIDPEICILRVEDMSGALACAIVNFACHPVSGTPNREKFYFISADYPGYTTKVIEEVEGGICLFALGTTGNINPNRIGRRNPRAEIGKALGGEVLRRIQSVSTTGEVALKALKKPVTMPIKKNLPPDRIIDADKTKKTLTTEVQVLKIGDIYILGLPGEVLVEVGLDIKKRAGIENLFIVSLSNDACGYVCHRQAYKEGGYEPGSGTNLAEGAGEIIIKEALNIIKQMKQSK
ncbi:MAG: neutral/alkaline non-lysosomal ceramidase N-terminal domain-containing protein [Planctomycetota bacterium]|jgi:hypothetical protein